MATKGGPRLLVTDRSSAVFLERSRVHVEGDRVVYHVVDDEMRREFNLPYVNVSVLFLGQGTSITQEATRLLAQDGVHVCFTGSGGTPIHLGSLTTYASTDHLRRLIPIYLDPSLSLHAAKSIMRDRVARLETIPWRRQHHGQTVPSEDAVRKLGKTFLEGISRSKDTGQLLGYEGNFTRACYALFARSSFHGDGFRRRPGEKGKSADDIANRLIDHGNYLCYGMAGAALWTLGINPSMSVLHGKTRAGGLVFDLADSFKDAFVLPIAFDAAGDDAEREFRARIIESFDDNRVLKLAIESVEHMIASAENSRT